MLRIMHVEEIADLLLLLPDLIQQQERRSIDFARNAGAWLSSLERVFAASRLYQAGSIAMLRSNLVAAEQGQVPAGIEFRGRPSRSRLLNAVASQALQRAAEVASTLIAENQPRLAEAERVAQQIVGAALSRGLITARQEEVSNTQYLRMLRRSLVTSGDLESAVVRLEGLVGPHDALILFDRALAPHLDVTSLAVQS
ncbi:MAG: hypothetical protein HY699_14435 [Deltaproteobacteria bacterium]|nr:hypothetical protein [Deltaproteobacteria bacterium]